MASAAADALQFLHCFSNVLERQVIRQIRNTDAWRDDETDFSTFEFFVQLYGVENLLAGKLRR